MGLNSSDWGAITGGLVSAYNPQLGGQVQSLFQKNPKPVPQSQAIAAPATVVERVPTYVWVIGGVVGAVVIGFVLLKLTK